MLKTISLPNGIELKFDSWLHKYFRNDVPIPGVTKISGVLANAEWRIPWARKLMLETLATELDAIAISPEGLNELNYREVMETVRTATDSKKAINFGHAAHSYLEKFINWHLGRGEKPTPIKAPTLKKAISPFLDWHNTNKPDYIAAEEVVYFENTVEDFHYHYAGTLDLRFNLNGNHCLMDFKTAKEIHTDHIWQLVLYSLATEQSFGKPVDRLYICKLPKEGTPYKMREIIMTPFLRTVGPIIAAAILYEYEMKQMLK